MATDQQLQQLGIPVGSTDNYLGVPGATSTGVAQTADATKQKAQTIATVDSQLPGYTPLLFKWNAPTDKMGAPTLTPTSSDIINVFDDFDWTLTPKPGRQHVPRIILTEYRQTQSSELRGYLYSLRGEVNNIAVAANIAADKTGLSDQLAKVNNVVDTVTQKIKSGLNISTANLDSSTSDPMANSPAFVPYQGLYAVTPTGFTYQLPYFTNANMVKVSNGWGNSNGDILKGLQKTGSGLGSIIGALSDKDETTSERAVSEKEQTVKDYASIGLGAVNIVRGLAQTTIGTTAGMLKKEDLYAFNGASAREDVQVSFYLYNTIGSVEQIQKNWDFCYLMTYQNLPNRKGINFLDAPCLYKVEIPGYKNLPLAYLSNISIENVGNVRVIDITTGETASSTVNDPTIKMIPEAYRITLGFSGVLLNTRNTFLSNADPSNKINITVQ